MKGIIPVMALVFVAVFAMIIVYTGSSFVGTANLFKSAELVSIGGSQCTVQNGNSVCPLIAYYKCDYASGGIKYVNITHNLQAFPSSPFIEYKCNVYSEQCTYMFKSSTTSLMTQVQYYTSTDSVKRLLQKSSSITIKRTESIFFSDVSIYGGSIFIEQSFNPYTIWSYSPSGGAMEVYKNQWGCNLPSKTSSGTGYITECKDASNCNPSFVYDNKQFLDFHEAVNYLDKWVNCPIDLNYQFMPNFATYGNVYCAGDGHIYSLGSTSVNGNCYSFPKSEIGKVDCCPNAIGYCANNQVCDSTGHCPILGTNNNISCMSDFQCLGQGTWIKNPANQLQSAKGSCVNGQCVITTKTIGTCTGTQSLQVNPQTGVGECIESGTPPIAPSNIQPPASCDVICWLMNVISAIVIGAILVGIILAIWLFTPLRAFMPFVGMLRNPKNFAIASVAVGIIIMLLYSGFVLSAKASIFGV